MLRSSYLVASRGKALPKRLQNDTHELATSYLLLATIQQSYIHRISCPKGMCIYCVSNKPATRYLLLFTCYSFQILNSRFYSCWLPASGFWLLLYNGISSIQETLCCRPRRRDRSPPPDTIARPPGGNRYPLH